MRRLCLISLSCVLGSSLACGPDSSSVSEGGEEWADGRTLIDTFIPASVGRADLIVVIDDSPSMRGHMSTMAANVGAFGELLAQLEFIDARVAITTTSVPGPTCEGARALGGSPIVESCRAHLEDFVGPDEHAQQGGESEDLQALCEQSCSLETIERVISPGSTEDGGLAERPWIDGPGTFGGGNLAEGVEYGEALSCALMQGFGGCQFESPLEAAARMVERYADPNDTMFGFRRPDAALMVVVISDEDDCSHPDGSGTIFSPAGDQLFWPPGATEPLSAICFNAGVVCDEQSGACNVSDMDSTGSPTTDPGLAVLFNPEDRLRAAFEAASEFALGDSPLVSVLGGYRSNGDLVYAQPEPGSEHEAYAQAYGIGPGCTGSDVDGAPVRAAPGGRLAAATETFTPGARFSICDWDWSVVFEPVFGRIRDQIRPWCFPGEGEADWACVADLGGGVAGLAAPDCVVEQVDGEQRETVSPCERDAEGNWLLDELTSDFLIPAGESACWAYQLDVEGLSESNTDDPDVECTDVGARGSLKVARNEPAPYEAYYALRCRPCE